MNDSSIDLTVSSCRILAHIWRNFSQQLRFDIIEP